VADGSETLTINYGGDFGGGVNIHSKVNVSGQIFSNTEVYTTGRLAAEGEIRSNNTIRARNDVCIDSGKCLSATGAPVCNAYSVGYDCNGKQCDSTAPTLAKICQMKTGREASWYVNVQTGNSGSQTVSYWSWDRWVSYSPNCSDGSCDDTITTYIRCCYF
jgi:hypothetical protein